MSPQSDASGWFRDLLLVATVAVLAPAALASPAVPWPVEWALGLPFLIVVPGWAVVAALRPAAPRSSGGSPTRADDGPGWIVRLALAVTVSVLVVAGVGLVASVTTGIRRLPVVGGVSAVTLAGVVVAWLRRRRRAPDRRANPLGGGRVSPIAALGTSTLQRLVTVLALVVLVSTVAFAAANPPAGEDGFTEFYVLTADENGNLTAADYPDVTSGDTLSLYFAIENEAGQATTYDVLGRAVDPGADARRLDRFQTTVEDGERVIVQRSMTPPTTTDDGRLEFLLYTDGVPTDPGPENADIALRLGGADRESAGTTAEGDA